MTCCRVVKWRGGKSKKPSRNTPIKTQSIKKRRKVVEEDDYEEEDDEDNYRPKKSSKAKKSKLTSSRKESKVNNKGRMMSLIPWGSNGQESKKGLAVGLKEKLEDIAKKGQSVYKDVYRRAKV